MAAARLYRKSVTIPERPDLIPCATVSATVGVIEQSKRPLTYEVIPGQGPYPCGGGRI